MSWRNRAVKHRVGYWPLSSAAGVITPDASGHGMHGTLVNAPTWAETMWGRQCVELDGTTQYVDLGDLTYLNAVSSYTLMFWMNQDIIDQTDIIFRKRLDALNEGRVVTRTTGKMDFIVDDGTANHGEFDYSTAISAGAWHHVAMVYDGSQTGNADRLIVYVDGKPITLSFVGTIPAVTADLTGAEATIGASAATFNGKISEFQIHDVPLTRDEVNALMRGR